MASIPVFGKKEFSKGLIALGFTIDVSKGKGGHAKASHPTKRPDPMRQRPFITVQGKKEYANPDYRSDLIKEVMAFGFSKEDVIAAIAG